VVRVIADRQGAVTAGKRRSGPCGTTQPRAHQFGPHERHDRVQFRARQRARERRPQGPEEVPSLHAGPHPD